MPVALGRHPPGRQPERAGGDQERSIGSGELLAERLDRAAIGVGGALEVTREGELVLERQVDHAVGGCGPASQAVEIVERAAVHLCPGRGECIGGGVGASEPDDLMARGEELGDDGGADPARRAGDEYTHEKPPFRQR